MIPISDQTDQTWARPGEPNAERIARLERRVVHLEQRLEWLWNLSRYRFQMLAGSEDELGSYEDGGR